MSYQEKSAWIVVISMIAIYSGYFAYIALTPAALERFDVVLFVGVVSLLILLQIIGHILAAIFNREKVDEALDERDRLVVWRAGATGYSVLGLGLFFSFFALYVDLGREVHMHLLLAILVMGTIAEYASRIYYYRRGV